MELSRRRLELTYRASLAAIFAAAALQRLVFAGAPFADGDTWGYLAPAVSLRLESEYVHIDGRAFVYPGFVYGILAIFDDYRWIAIVQHLLGLATGALLALSWERLGRLLPDGAVAARPIHRVLGLALVGSYLLSGSVLETERMIRPESIFGFFGSILIFASVRLVEIARSPAEAGQRTWALLVAGVATFDAALLYFLRTNFALSVPVALAGVAGLLLKSGVGLRRTAIALAASGLLAAAFLWVPERRLAERDPKSVTFPAEILLFWHMDLAADEMRADLTDPGVAGYDKVFLRRVLEGYERERAENSVRLPPAFPHRGFDPDRLHYGATAAAIQQHFGPDAVTHRAFCLSYFARGVCTSPLRYACKVLRELGTVYCRVRPWLYHKIYEIDPARRRGDSLADLEQYRDVLRRDPAGAGYLAELGAAESRRFYPLGTPLLTFPYKAWYGVLELLYLPALIGSLALITMVRLGRGRSIQELGWLAAAALLPATYAFGISLTVAATNSLEVRRYVFLQAPFLLYSEFAMAMFVAAAGLAGLRDRATTLEGPRVGRRARLIGVALAVAVLGGAVGFYAGYKLATPSAAMRSPQLDALEGYFWNQVERRFGRPQWSPVVVAPLRNPPHSLVRPKVEKAAAYYVMQLSMLSGDESFIGRADYPVALQFGGAGDDREAVLDRAQPTTSSAYRLANLGSGVVDGIHVAANGRDWSDVAGILERIFPEGTREVEPEERALRVWRFLSRNRYHWLTPAGSSADPHDPVALLNAYGYGFCDDASAAAAALLAEAGLEARVHGLEGHVVCEARLPHGWAVLDADLGLAYRDAAGRLAGVDDLTANPDLLDRPIRPPEAPDPIDPAQNEQVKAAYLSRGDNVAYPPELPSRPRRIRFTLRPGETVECRPEPRGFFFAAHFESGYWSEPPAYGNGCIVYELPIARSGPEVWGAGNDAAGLERAREAGAPFLRSAGASASIALPVLSPFPIAWTTLLVRGRPTRKGGGLAVETSLDGETFTPAGEVDPLAGETEFYLTPRLANGFGTPDRRLIVRLVFRGGRDAFRLESAILRSIIQLAPRALPQLEAGRNRIGCEYTEPPPGAPPVRLEVAFPR